MLFRRFLPFILLALSLSAEAFELIAIQAVSETKKTFITRNGKRQGISIGMSGTFTAEDVSVLAKVINVTGNFTQWQLINNDALLPFEKGSIVTYYPATEYIWALAPESERKKYIKSEIPRLRRSWIVKGSLSRAIAESVSEVPANTPRRGGYMGEIYYEKDFYRNFSFDIGARYEQEVINVQGASLVTKRNLLIGDINYYFDAFRDYLQGGRFYIGVGMGYGLSHTEGVAHTQSGPVSLLPTIKLGFSLPFNDEWQMLIDAASESLNTREEQEDGKIQTTTQTNFKVGFGLRKYF